MGCGSRGSFYYERPVYREVPREKQSHTKKEDPLEILKLRYVNGEITSDEYNRMKQIILVTDLSTEPTKKYDDNSKKEVTQRQENIQRPKVSLKKS